MVGPFTDRLLCFPIEIDSSSTSRTEMLRSPVYECPPAMQGDSVDDEFAMYLMMSTNFCQGSSFAYEHLGHYEMMQSMLSGMISSGFQGI